MHDWASLSHVRWDCEYHVVIVPKYRQKRLYGKIRKRVREIIRDLCRQRGVELLEGHLMGDHVHMCLQIPPKFRIAFVIGFLVLWDMLDGVPEASHRYQLSGLILVILSGIGMCTSIIKVAERRNGGADYKDAILRAFEGERDGTKKVSAVCS